MGGKEGKRGRLKERLCERKIGERKGWGNETDGRRNRWKKTERTNDR